VPSVQAHTHGHDAGWDGGAEGSMDTRSRDPILLADIDRALDDSARVGNGDPDAPVRAWRDTMAVALESLAYARAVLSADVGILRHRLSAPPGDRLSLTGDRLAGELSDAMSSRQWGHGWAPPSGTDAPALVDWGVFARSDQLMSTHDEMARIDLSSRADVSRVIGGMESQLADLSLRQEAVEGRLREIRAAIVRQYERGGVTTEDPPG
jgi:hypothetical protein